MSSPASPASSFGYLALLRRNAAFRNVWLAEVVSLAGDWFTSIALFAMLLEFTGKGEAVGLALVARFLPGLVFGPLAGVVADRAPRKAVMIACDLSRALLVLGFLLVRSASDVWLAYLLSFAQMTLTVFFETAESAAVGAIVAREDIVAANALQGITWSAMLSFGALLGGVVAGVFGRDAAFVIDSATFLLSALAVARARIPVTTPAPRTRSLATTLGITDAVEGLRYVFTERPVREVILLKAFWGLSGGGAILLYSVIGERQFPLGKGAAFGIGTLYAARGMGALIGPVLARARGGDTEPALQRAIALAFLALIGGYACLAVAPTLAIAAASLVLAHMGASTVWTFSTALINLRVPDGLRGRTFAAETTLMTSTMILSTLATGAGLDRFGLTPRTLLLGLSAVLIVPALLVRRRRPESA